MVASWLNFDPMVYELSTADKVFRVLSGYQPAEYHCSFKNRDGAEVYVDQIPIGQTGFIISQEIVYIDIYSAIPPGMLKYIDAEIKGTINYFGAYEIVPFLEDLDGVSLSQVLSDNNTRIYYEVHFGGVENPVSLSDFKQTSVYTLIGDCDQSVRKLTFTSPPNVQHDYNYTVNISWSSDYADFKYSSTKEDGIITEWDVLPRNDEHGYYLLFPDTPDYRIYFVNSKY